MVKHVSVHGNDWEKIRELMDFGDGNQAIVEYLRLNLDGAHFQSLGSILGEQVKLERKAPPTEEQILQMHI